MNNLIFLVLYFVFIPFSYSGVNPSCQIKFGGNLCANIKFLSGVSRKKDSKFEVNFLSLKGGSVNLEIVPKLKLWMVMKSGHGHGSDELMIKKVGNTYHVENVWFLMMGKWEIQTEVNYIGKVMNKSIFVCVGKQMNESHIGKCNQVKKD
jgi:hypothetical protein